ncbi:hypothetical protein [Actinoplanes missouriensis]|nr:hypothetical protein [Actinoplanes missouriensis]
MGFTDSTRSRLPRDVSINVAANLIATAVIVSGAVMLGLVPRTPVAITWLIAMACTTLFTVYVGRIPDRHLTHKELRISAALASTTLVALAAVLLTTGITEDSAWSIFLAGLTLIAYFATAVVTVQLLTKARRRLRRIPGMHWIETSGQERFEPVPFWVFAKDRAADVRVLIRAWLHRP